MAVKRYDGSAWQTVAGLGAQGPAATSSSIATWVKTASGGETSLSGNDDSSQALSYTVGQELVFINGTLLKRGSDYTATNGTSITGLTALAANDVATVWTVNAFSVTGAIANTIVDAKGDLLVGTAADTPGRLAVGTNGQVLTAASTTGTGLTWTTPAAAGGKTLLSTTTLTSASVSISVNQGYKDLEIWVTKVSLTGQGGPSFKDNNLPGTYYSFLREGAASSAAGRTDVYLIGSGDLNTGADAGNFVIYVYNYTSTERKIFNWTGQLRAFSDNTDRSIFGGGYMDSTGALTDLSIFTTGGPTFDGGTVKVYGVN